MIFRQIFNSQIDLSYQVVRLNYAPRKFYCMILEFTRSRSRMGCRLILRWRFPKICLALPLFFEPFTFLDTRRDERLRTFSPVRKNLEFSTVTPFESV